MRVALCVSLSVSLCVSVSDSSRPLRYCSQECLDTARATTHIKKCMAARKAKAKAEAGKGADDGAGPSGL